MLLGNKRIVSSKCYIQSSWMGRMNRLKTMPTNTEVFLCGL